MDIHGLLGKNDILDKEMDLNQKKLDRIIAEMATNNAEIERLKKIENEMMKEEVGWAMIPKI